MCKSEEYAGILRIGERARDASDKIRGFLYQDLLAIDLIMTSNQEDKIYVEWVEDILIENSDDISIYQVKHYPESNLEFQEIYKNMFYQFLKFKLMESHKKEVTTYCLYQAKNYTDVNIEVNSSYIKKENDFNMINKSNIKERLNMCSNMPSRIELIFDEVACTNFLNEFNFQKKEKKNIEDTRKMLKTMLYNNVVVDPTLFQMIEKKNVEDILLAIAIQYIQTSYYKKLEDYKKRYMTKILLINYINGIVGIDERKCNERIKFIVLGYIDEFCSEIISEIEHDKNVETYKEIYFSTKDFFMENLKTKKQRFKFLNSISTDRYEELNWESYERNVKSETDRFLEHKTNINEFIKTIWKILFDIGCKDFSEYIKENDDCFFFEFLHEKANPVIILSSGNGDSSREASKALPRISKMCLKPQKWYLQGKLKGIYPYSFDINKIKDTKINGDFSLLHMEQDCFKIECMDCIACGQGEMDIKDVNLCGCIFDFNCIKGD
ncbi:hypothetical protein [Clostridium estertheticum]|uniref:Uncharacterized protein n=1 Tax=Clostridium estertheticum TaxID=238834 RepID=A0AA47I699_9CLOT|nr:hypothetical protein [Clostridium estertheticum]MBU3156338.1 hypothetical protein [Clostridium estertheticum]WAG59605.1 hypothetical protein LL038_18515 [Clostridium estertheticum]